MCLDKETFLAVLSHDKVSGFLSGRRNLSEFLLLLSQNQERVIWFLEVFQFKNTDDLQHVIDVLPPEQKKEIIKQNISLFFQGYDDARKAIARVNFIRGLFSDEEISRMLDTAFFNALLVTHQHTAVVVLNKALKIHVMREQVMSAFFESFLHYLRDSFGVQDLSDTERSLLHILLYSLRDQSDLLAVAQSHQSFAAWARLLTCVNDGLPIAAEAINALPVVVRHALCLQEMRRKLVTGDLISTVKILSFPELEEFYVAHLYKHPVEVFLMLFSDGFSEEFSRRRHRRHLLGDFEDQLLPSLAQQEPGARKEILHLLLKYIA